MANQAPPRDYHHPYTPYDIQFEFMNAVYECIEHGKVGMFESPTDNDEPAWIIEHARNQRRQALLQQKTDLETRLSKIRAKEERARQRFENGEPARKKLRNHNEDYDDNTNEEARFLLDDYESDEESKLGGAGVTEDGISAETKALMQKLGMNANEPKDEDVEPDDELKIFYCSRTHSQLTQFVQELRRVKLPSALSPGPQDGDTPNKSGETKDQLEEILKHLSLGSRKNLCINPKVSSLGNTTAINERCLELQQQGDASHRCPHLPTKEKEILVQDFRDHALARIRDIEELGNLGKKLSICPYYASRSVIKPSEIVTLPYQLLLQKSTRDALGLSLKGHVVIIDEAHNLMDTISNIYSVNVSLKQILRARAQLGVYLQRFRNRLKGKNRVYIAQTVRLLDSLTGYMEDKSRRSEQECLVNVGDLMAGKGVDQINLYKLMRYLQESKLARKVEGYIEHQEQQQATTGDKKQKKNNNASLPVLTHIQSFLLVLTNPSAEGRLFFARNEEDAFLKYMLLDPTHHFREIVEEARAVILAGGTMSPMSDYTNHLLSYVPKDRIMTLSCGHVIPSGNLIAWPVSNSPGGREFEFTFEKRNTPSMIDDAGQAVLNLCRVVPDGLVVFFPSYAYLDELMKRWETTSTSNKIRQYKQVGPSLYPPIEGQPNEEQIFQEPKDSGSSIDDILQQYSTSIDSGKGGLLLSVIGGKLSEGINFSDRLGRGVIVVGLPYPNIHSAEWKAKIEYIEQRTYEGIMSTGSAVTEARARAEAKAAGRDFYENACMRAVNQSIGRAIRHRNDYACIILLDKRYSNERVKGKLPAWIQRGLVDDGGKKPFSAVVGSLSAFFRAKKVVVS
ncbi:MAG: hypothetical protein M1823_001607 [Watsoniomyces obsoletus]|nr:MAG: hypothetical protein M1823_001607 [Watsoniomyces obsoletus]